MLRAQESWIYLKNSALAVVDLRNSKGKATSGAAFFLNYTVHRMHPTRILTSMNTRT